MRYLWLVVLASCTYPSDDQEISFFAQRQWAPVLPDSYTITNACEPPCCYDAPPLSGKRLHTFPACCASSDLDAGGCFEESKDGSYHAP